MESKRGNIKAFATSATIKPTHREHMAGRKCWELDQPHDRDPSSLPSPSLPPPFPPPSRRAHHCPLPIYTAQLFSPFLISHPPFYACPPYSLPIDCLYLSSPPSLPRAGGSRSRPGTQGAGATTRPSSFPPSLHPECPRLLHSRSSCDGRRSVTLTPVELLEPPSVPPPPPGRERRARSARLMTTPLLMAGCPASVALFFPGGGPTLHKHRSPAVSRRRCRLALFSLSSLRPTRPSRRFVWSRRFFKKALHSAVAGEAARVRGHRLM